MCFSSMVSSNVLRRQCAFHRFNVEERRDAQLRKEDQGNLVWWFIPIAVHTGVEDETKIKRNPSTVCHQLHATRDHCTVTVRHLDL